MSPFDKSDKIEIENVVGAVLQRHRRLQNTIIIFASLFSALLVAVPLALIMNSSIRATQKLNYQANCERFTILADINEEIFREDQAQSQAMFSGEKEQRHLAKTFGITVKELKRLTEANNEREERRLKVLEKLATSDCTLPEK